MPAYKPEYKIMQEVETHAILSEFELKLLPENQLLVVLQMEEIICCPTELMTTRI